MPASKGFDFNGATITRPRANAPAIAAAASS